MVKSSRIYYPRTGKELRNLEVSKWPDPVLSPIGSHIYYIYNLLKHLYNRVSKQLSFLNWLKDKVGTSGGRKRKLFFNYIFSSLNSNLKLYLNLFHLKRIQCLSKGIFLFFLIIFCITTSIAILLLQLLLSPLRRIKIERIRN